jgi:hypothetical protein
MKELVVKSNDVIYFTFCKNNDAKEGMVRVDIDDGREPLNALFRNLQKSTGSKLY